MAAISRIDLVRSELEKLDLDACLISQHHNIFYLTAFQGLSEQEREAWCVVTKEKIYLVTDGRYIDSVDNSNLTIRELTAENALPKILSGIIKEEKVTSLGFEAEDLTYHEYSYFKKNAAVSLKETRRLVSGIREKKDDEEIAAITEACRIMDQCLKEVSGAISLGQTEREIALAIEWWLKQHGSDLAFDPIVAINEHAAIPHFNTKADGDAKVTAGAVILIDCGALNNHYMSDITRMLVVGKPTAEFSQAYQALLEAQEIAIQLLGEKQHYKNVDLMTRAFLEKKGYPSYAHSTGHGLGLEIHEGPKVALNSKDTIQPGHIVTIEPGIYLKGKFGIRIEDTVVIDETGQPRCLTLSPKALIPISV